MNDEVGKFQGREARTKNKRCKPQGIHKSQEQSSANHESSITAQTVSPFGYTKGEAWYCIASKATFPV